MSRRTIVFCTLALLAAALFVRLGFWQLARLHEKVQRNAAIAARQRAEPVELASLSRDPDAVRYRRAVLTGKYDYDQELVVSGRTRQGSPGVDLVTPMRVPGTDTAILVNRGWVYSPNSATVDRARWRERDSAAVVGYVEQFAPDAPPAPPASDPRIVRRLTRREASARVPYPLAPYLLVATGDTASSRPARREMPALDSGPHRGYAIQWFSFAAIAIVGALAVIRRERQAP